MRRRVLIVAPYFPPRRRVGSVRPMRFVRHLPSQGWAPAVICLDTPGSTLTEGESETLAEVPTHRVRPPFARPRPPRAASRKSSTEPSPSRLTHWLSDAATEFDRQFPVDTWLPVLMGAQKQATEFAQKFGPDAIWSTADPWSSHVLAGSLANEMRLPWIADFRDPWTLCDVRDPRRGRVARWFDRAVESGVLGSASRVVFTSERTSQRYRAAFPSLAQRIRTLPNSFDGSAFVPAPPPPAAGPARGVSRDGELRLCFFGAFRQLSSVGPVLEMLQHAAAVEPAVREVVRVESSAPLEPVDVERAETAGLARCFRPFERVPYDRAMTVLTRADLILVSSSPERSEIIPAKLWDGLASGRPILSVASNPDVGEVLRRTGTGEQLPPAAAGARLADCVRAFQQKRPFPVAFAPNPEAISAYDAPAATETLARWLEEVAGPLQR